MDVELDENWKKLLLKLSENFGDDLELDAILFLIGVQEYGKGFKKFSKDQKLDIMHIAICAVLEPFGYYEYEGLDADGWPHWRIKEKLPPLKPAEQNLLMRRAVVDYFKEHEIIT